MGGVDEQIINALMEDSRVSFSEIGRKLNLSEGAIRKRVANLVKNKAIKKSSYCIARPVIRRNWQTSI